MFKSSPLTWSNNILRANNILGEYIEPMLWSFDITNTFINIYNFRPLARRVLLIYCFFLDVVKSHHRNLKHLILWSCFVLNQNYSEYHYFYDAINLHDFSSNCLLINVKIFVCIMNVTSHQILPNAFVASSQSKRFMKMSISPYLTYSVSHYLWLFGYHLLFACIHLMNKNIDNKNPNNISNFFGFGIGENRIVQRNKIYSWNKSTRKITKISLENGKCMHTLMLSSYGKSIDRKVLFLNAAKLPINHVWIHDKENFRSCVDLLKENTNTPVMRKLY